MRKSLIVCLFATIAACGGDDDSISFGDLPDTFVNAQCDNAVQCGTQPDDATCQASTAIDPGEIESIQNAIDAGTVIFHGDSAAACADQISGQGCDFPGLHDDAANQADPCTDMFEGTVAAGGACDIDIECAGATSTCTATDQNCDTDTTCCASTCVAGNDLPDVAIGGTCGDNTGPCAFNAYCKTGGAATGVCTALITQDGAACDELDACANPMICDVIFSQTPTCETPGGTGAACDPMDLIPCSNSDDFCDPTNKCSPTLDPGAACPQGDECVGFSTCVNGSCVENPGAGDPCVDGGDQDCLGSLSCISGTCQFPPASMVCN